MKKIAALIALLLIMPFSVQAINEGACALPDAGEEIVAEDFRGNLSNPGEALQEETTTEARVRINNSTSKKLLNREAAYAKAGVPSEGVKSKGYVNITAKQPQYSNFTKIESLGEPGSGNGNTFRFTDKEGYLDKVEETYNSIGDKLNPRMRGLISNYLDEGPNGDGIFSTDQGMPGFHAEVRATNQAFNLVNNPEIGLDKFNVATIKLAGKLPGGDFIACPNCSGILPSPINIVTGRQ